MPVQSTSHPLGLPTVSGTTVTVETMLNQPSRVTRMIMDLSLQRFIADKVFSSGGGVTGGAVVYDQATKNELYSDRDVQRVDPGAEFPVITSSVQIPKVAAVEKWGGKVFITDEARDRNNTAMFTREIRKLTNTVVRKINARAVAELEAAITAFPSQTYAGNDWGAVVTSGTSQSVNGLWPAADFAKANMLADKDELGITYNLIIVNPTQLYRLTVLYGDKLQALLSTFGFSLYSSNRVPVGTAYICSSGQVGEMRLEKPLSTESWRDADGRQQTWVQADVRPVMFVTDPSAIIKVTGLGT